MDFKRKTPEVNTTNMILRSTKGSKLDCNTGIF